jgi:hypothetical protein
MNGGVMTQCGLLGLACGERASTEPRVPGLVRRVGRARFVRPESCDAHSSQSQWRSCSEAACWESVSPFQGWESFFVGTRGDAPVYHIAPL